MLQIINLFCLRNKDVLPVAGNRGPGRTPLDWTTRLKIAAGAARGLAFIHNSCKALKLVHGNIKSANILIDRAGNACVSDFGLCSFAPSLASNPKSSGYRAPESLDGRRLTQKADVYSFGVLLLELLTGKWIHACISQKVYIFWCILKEGVYCVILMMVQRIDLNVNRFPLSKKKALSNRKTSK